MKSEEHDTQCAIFRWAAIMENTYPDLKYMFSTLNGVKLTIGQATKAKRAGNKRGVPDIWLPVKRLCFSGLVVELKKEKGGTVSKEQKEWIEFLSQQGYNAVVCRGFDEAIKMIEGYLKLTEF